MCCYGSIFTHVSSKGIFIRFIYENISPKSALDAAELMNIGWKLYFFLHLLTY